MIPKRELMAGRLGLARRTQNGSFFDVLGRRSAAFGYEHRGMEAWVYPLKIVDTFELSFRIDGYNLPFRGRDVLTSIEARPEATIFTYSHAAFTVREIVFAPIDEQGLIVLLDVNTVVPMAVEVEFRPKLRLMWAGTSMTPFFGQDEKEKYYYIGEETNKFYGIVGTPGAKDVSLMPYQEEPRDVPLKYQVRVTPEEARANFIPIVIAASTEGRDKAVETYRRLHVDAPALYEKNVKYYEDFLTNSTYVVTPDPRLNQAFSWAKIGIEKGVVTSPFLGTGIVAGFRTSGESERPGFAWYFGRDALWTSFAINSYGDLSTTKKSLEFLKKFQRPDGKIPHEISQAANQTDWWNAYPYAWNSTDATPLYVIAHEDYFRTSGDHEYLKASWESILKAYLYEESTDTDNNGLIENTKFGHGWVEGDSLYPPHEEIYLQGLWIQASQAIASMSDVVGDKTLAKRALANAERTRNSMEKTFWLEDRGFYAFGTQMPRSEPVKAEPGPNLERRQKRLDELMTAKIYDENTVLPAVPMCWNVMRDDVRAQKEIDHLGSAKIATDWGARILADDSKLYDPLSYHSGSVWPLFTGWQSVAAYNYGRPSVGYQALMANTLLSYTNALGYVTELLSGDLNAPFGRSSHHQVWSEAMVVTPVMRGLFGIDVSGGGKRIRFAPQIPADWNDAGAWNVRTGDGAYDFVVARKDGVYSVFVSRRDAKGPATIELAPAFALDAVIKRVTVEGKNLQFRSVRRGDRQFVEVTSNLEPGIREFKFEYDEGTDVFQTPANLVAGAESSGLRIIRSEARKDGLFLVLEGRAGSTYDLGLVSTLQFPETQGVRTYRGDDRNWLLRIPFTGADGKYVRRELLLKKP